MKMIPRKRIYRPEEDFEIEMQDLIDKIQRVEIKEPSYNFDKHFFEYLLSERPTKIKQDSLLLFVANQIKKSVHSKFIILINLLFNYLKYESSSFASLKTYLIKEIHYEKLLFGVKSPHYNKNRFTPEQTFYSNLLTKIRQDFPLQNQLKTDKALSNKIRFIISHLNIPEHQLKEIENYLHQ